VRRGEERFVQPPGLALDRPRADDERRAELAKLRLPPAVELHGALPYARVVLAPGGKPARERQLGQQHEGALLGAHVRTERLPLFVETIALVGELTDGDAHAVTASPVRCPRAER